MSGQRIVVIGGSAGGVEALFSIAGSFPAKFAAPIFITIHVPATAPSILPTLIARRGALPAKHAEDGERYKAGMIYVAPPDRHLLIGPKERLRVVRGPRENRHRPAIDPLFRSAASVAGSNVIAVVLSGALDDGTAGAIAVKNSGGAVVVQDPAEAMHASMPQSVIANVNVDSVVSLRDLPRKLIELVERPQATEDVGDEMLERMKMETRITEFGAEALQDDDRPGKPSAFSCPDCGGVLWEIDEEDYPRFRCRVGHALSPESMLEAQSDRLEESLWSALKTLEESARLPKRLSGKERQRGHEWIASRFEEREKDARERAEVIRRVLISSTSEVPQPAADEMEAGTQG